MRLKNVLITAKDIHKSAAFYKELFGLQEILIQDGNIIMTEGLVIQDRAVWEKLLEKGVHPQNHATELYFEESDLEAFAKKLEHYHEPVRYVNRLMEDACGKKVIRLYDPDGNLIEAGTPGPIWDYR